MIKAVIFDMDGLLIDSEPLWREAGLKTRKKFGINLPPEIAHQTMGLRSDEVVKHWHHHFPWDEPSQKVVNDYFLETVVQLIKNSDIELPGVHEAIAVIEKAGLPMALASSSPLKVIRAGIEKLHIEHKLKLIYSAEQEPYGKPHPGVYITTADKLGIPPELCLAFEDSPNGVLSAKSAKMKCIAVPDKLMAGNKTFGIADKILSSLLEFNLSVLQEMGYKND
ncbi:MAG: hexitol phosphatase HxpB [Patescibacteria group bacterium]